MQNPLQAFILTLLTPILPEAAARQAIAAYKSTGPDQLITIAQIVGFAVTALDNLRLSMPEDLSLSMKLRLRGNANALTRTSQRATAALDTQRRDPEPAPPAEPQNDRQRDLSWASAMTDVAAEFAAELPNLPPEQRAAHQSRINALSRTATALKRGDIPLKSRLLGSTALRG